MTPSATYSCLLRTKWDWSNSYSTGKWSTPQEAFKYSTLLYNSVSGVEASYPRDVVDTRIKVRGTGRNVVIRYESTEGKDFELLGYVVEFSAETRG